jgi:hypothetical protein
MALRRVSGPSGGVADSLDAAKAAFRAAWERRPSIDDAPAESRPSPASAFLQKSGRDILA